MVTLRNREGHSAAFEFARRLRDPRFRQHLADNGYQSGQTVVTALDDEPVSEVFSRILTETEPPVVIAIYRPSVTGSFVFMSIDQVQPDLGDQVVGESCEVGSGSSIGMVYDAMTTSARRHTVLTVPNHWDAPRFRVELSRSSFS
jgi:hypothetical protein